MSNMAWRTLTLLVIIAWFFGCATQVRELSDFKSHAQQGDYAYIAEQKITCAANSRGCNQINLIKGDACFRLAEGGDSGHWDCAIQHLSRGLDMTGGTRTDMDSTQPYNENLLEALRQRRDLAASNAEATPFTDQLETRAQTFLQAFPTAPAGYYYLASAQLTQALDIADTSPSAACRRLNDLLSLLTRAPTEAGRYTESLRRVQTDVHGAKSTVSGCI